MTAVRDARELTVTEATERGVAGLLADVENGDPVVVTRHSRPVVAVVPVRRLAEIDEAAADLRDLALVLARSAADTGRGRLAGVVVEQALAREPVPDWLAQRLVHTAGIPREQVAALSLEQAVDLWTAFVTASPRSEPIGD